MIPMTIFDANCLYVLKCLALKPKPQPLNQGGGFRKTGHSLPII